MPRAELNAAHVGISDADITDLAGWLGRTEAEILSTPVGELTEALSRLIDQSIAVMAKLAGRTEDEMRQIVIGARRA